MMPTQTSLIHSNGSSEPENRGLQGILEAIAGGEIGRESAVANVAIEAALIHQFTRAALDWAADPENEIKETSLTQARNNLLSAEAAFSEGGCVESASRVKAVLGLDQMFRVGVLMCSLGNVHKCAEPARVATYIVKHPITGLIKIGQSRSPTERIKNLQCGAGADLQVLLITEQHTEKDLHRRFSILRVHGEWFNDNGEIAAFAASQR